jgi:hypothetical protein
MKVSMFLEPCLDMSKHELNDHAYLQHSSKDFDVLQHIKKKFELFLVKYNFEFNKLCF